MTASGTGLISGMSYKARAYSTSAFGTAYGSVKTFSTTGTAPTATRTATPTPTRTATATSTATPTVTAAPTGTPVPPTAVPSATATPLPTVVPTLTATAQPTNTVLPSPTVTATPTVPTTTVWGVVKVNGVAVASALVYIPGLGSALTDENGLFNITGADPTKTYTAVVQKTGFDFSALSNLPVSSGNFVTVTGDPVLFNARNCVQTDIAVKLNAAVQEARFLRESASDDFNKLDPETLINLPGGKTASARQLRDRVGEQLNSYLQTSGGIPEITLDCTNIASCQQVSLDSLKARLVSELNNLRREGELANRVLRQRGKRSSKASLTRRSEILKHNLKGKGILKRVPKSSGQCG